ncbi:MAG: hypothetical protein H6563_13920 [Lewinellaceae bacterium]|nr:hypothetical protein [Lewinellaceae bacterium]
MRASRILPTLLLAVVVLQPHAHSQEPDLPGVQQVADSLYGLNDLLVNGRIYANPHPRAIGHPFFPEATFSPGVVYVKGEKFDQALINYNAEQDELILDVSKPMPWIGHIVVNHNLVDSFRIGDRHFVHAHTLPPNFAGRQYLEKVFEGKFSLFASHEKLFNPDISHLHPHGVFLNKPTRLLLLKDGAFTEVTRKKQWLDYFPAHRKDIKRYLHKNRIHWKKAHVEQLRQAADFCNGFYENMD